MKKELTREEKIQKLVRCRVGLIKIQEYSRLKKCINQIATNANIKKGKTL